MNLKIKHCQNQIKSRFNDISTTGSFNRLITSIQGENFLGRIVCVFIRFTEKSQTERME